MQEKGITSSKSASSGRKHVDYFDLLRVIAAISVIYMHTSVVPLRYGSGTNWTWINVLTSVSFTGVPLFFMMSGYLILSDPRTVDIDLLLKKRIPRLLVPLAAWSVAAILSVMYTEHDFTVSVFFQRLISALSEPAAEPYWYMYTLIAIYLLSPMIAGGLRALDRKGHIFVITLIALASVQQMLRCVLPERMMPLFTWDFLAKIMIFNGHLCTFVLGYYLGNLNRRLPNWLLWCVAILVLAVISVGTQIRSTAVGAYDQTFQAQSCGFEILLATCIFLLAKQSVHGPIRFLQRVSVVPLLMPIYMMHILVIGMFHAVGWIPETLIDTLWETALNFVICYFAVKTAATIRPLCYLTSGMTYQQACDSCNWVYTFSHSRAK